MGKKVSLSELMGSGNTQGMALSRLHEVLGEKTPELPRDAVGRYRLVSALSQRYGPNFRSLPGVTQLMKEFDADVAVEQRIAKIKQIKYTPPKGGKRG